MSSAYGEAPDEDVLEEMIPELESRYSQEFNEDIKIEPDTNDRNQDKTLMYFKPPLKSKGEEKDFFEQIIAEELDVETANILYSTDPTGNNFKGYEVWVK